MEAAAPGTSNQGTMAFLWAALAGAAVSLVLGVYAREHDPAGQALFTLGFSGTINMKAWLATLALAAGHRPDRARALDVRQARVDRRRAVVGRPDPPAGGARCALLVTLPVVYHCLWSLGFETHAGSTRRFVHSMLGCLFYGAFTTKVLCVRSARMPGWALPVVGGLLFACLVGLWLTSSLWFFDQRRLPELLRRRRARQSRPRGPDPRRRGRRRVRDPALRQRAGPAGARCPAAGTANAGAAIYATRCASCHGEDGGGSFGPALGGGVVVGRFPDPDDQIAVVTEGPRIDARRFATA